MKTLLQQEILERDGRKKKWEGGECGDMAVFAGANDGKKYGASAARPENEAEIM